MAFGQNLKILSANCQGLRDKKKRLDVINYLSETKPGIICLQDTHLIDSDEANLKKLSNCHCIINGTQTNSRGVAVLLRNNFEDEIIGSKSDSEGNYLCVDLKLTSFSIRFINIDAPNQDKPQFFEN